jgi:hypothetical protein
MTKAFALYQEKMVDFLSNAVLHQDKIVAWDRKWKERRTNDGKAMKQRNNFESAYMMSSRLRTFIFAYNNK